MIIRLIFSSVLNPTYIFTPLKIFSSAKSHQHRRCFYCLGWVFRAITKLWLGRKMSEKAKLFDNKQFYRFVTFYLIYCCSFSVVYTKIKRRKMERKIIELFFSSFHIHIFIRLRFHLFRRLFFFLSTIEILIWIELFSSFSFGASFFHSDSFDSWCGLS
jgi:hypothetical protein